MKDNRLQIEAPVFDMFRTEFNMWLTHMLRTMNMKKSDKGTLTVKITVMKEEVLDMKYDRTIDVPQKIGYKFSVNVPTKMDYDNALPVGGTFLKELPAFDCFALEVMEKDEQIGFEGL